ncbi:hypothetical protein ARTHRO9AX_150236 [Arthrobacter sp. 9AX]|nr:hypothetical protein ARTHRO9AX_150236 [Arthrobacter sp. 9AX]
MANTLATGRSRSQDPADACNDNFTFAHCYKASCRGSISNEVATVADQAMQFASCIPVALLRIPRTPFILVLTVEENSHIGVVTGRELGSPPKFQGSHPAHANNLQGIAAGHLTRPVSAGTGFAAALVPLSDAGAHHGTKAQPHRKAEEGTVKDSQAQGYSDGGAHEAADPQRLVHGD